MKKIYNLLFLAIILAGCDSDGSDFSSQDVATDGKGGSLATFALVGDYLYTVDENDLSVFNISDTSDPVQVNRVPIGFDIETLFNYKNYLYMGSRTGMFIYSLSDPEFPEKLSRVEHFTACDPVIANNTHAFVTLHSNTFCGNAINLLEIYDITNITEPVLISSRNLVAPKGIGLYGNFLIVCDDEIKVFDISDPKASKLITSVNQSAFDVIVNGDFLIAIGENGLIQYSLSATSNNGLDLEKLSEIRI